MRTYSMPMVGPFGDRLVGLRAAGEQDAVVGDAHLRPGGVRGGGKDEQGGDRRRVRRMWTVQTPCAPPELRCNQRMATTNVSEREARQVAEAAREQEWKLPSFGKELFLGNFRLDLIHPQPRLDAAAIEKGERFLAELRRSSRTRSTRCGSSARRRSPTRSSRGSSGSARWG